jgi:hypothetical protein
LCRGGNGNLLSHRRHLGRRRRRHGRAQLTTPAHDQLGPERFFSEHGFGPSRSYELVWDERHYPHKAILGAAYELATGQHLASGDFEGGKSGAVAVLRKLGFTVQDKR